MNNFVVDSNEKIITNQQNSLVKLIVFEIGKLTLALPILQVQKVIKPLPVYGSGLSSVNLTHLAEQEVAVIDLHQKLFKTSLPEIEQTSGYFIITKNIVNEPMGIKVSTAPTLIDLPASQIRLIPDSYRRADTLEIASHVAVINQHSFTSQTIFILDLTKLT